MIWLPEEDEHDSKRLRRSFGKEDILTEAKPCIGLTKTLLFQSYERQGNRIQCHKVPLKSKFQGVTYDYIYLLKSI